MNDELKPCPFCGGEAEIHAFTFDGPYYVNCLGCAMQTPNTHTRAELISAWNTRSTPIMNEAPDAAQ
jgi:Lar family restriction alleviation protein